MTRRCLRILAKHDYPVIILTRSPLVLRDLDILHEFKWVRVGFSISSLSHHFYEPGVPKLEARLAALRKLKDEKIKTWVSLAPVAPQINLTDYNWLFKELYNANVSAISIGMLRFVGYDASKKMFEERTGLKSDRLFEGGSDIIAGIKQLA